jgi:hypothetical protein
MMRSYFVALPFIRTEDGIVPGEAIECTDPVAAALQAETLARMAGNIGAVAFSRTADDAGVFGEAVILVKFGDVPSDPRTLF